MPIEERLGSWWLRSDLTAGRGARKCIRQEHKRGCDQRVGHLGGGSPKWPVPGVRKGGGELRTCSIQVPSGDIVALLKALAEIW